MSILTYPLGFIGGGKEFYNGVMENSLRFEDGDSPQLALTPASAGNRKTWTFSFWFKRGNLDIDTYLISAGTGNSGWTEYIRFQTGDNKLKFNIADTNAQEAAIEIDGPLRDPSAWYHAVVVFDSTHGTANDRLGMYLNGERQTDVTLTSTVPQNQDSFFLNNTNIHKIGMRTYGDDEEFDGYMTDIYFIDGHALAAENFGEYKEGVWIPKAYAGPPPIVSDSSASNNIIVFNGTGIGHLNYDEAYIGESSIEFGSTNAASATIGNPTKIESGGPFDFTTEDWTIDFWIKTGPSVSGSHMTILHAEGDSNAAPSSADFYDFVWMNFDASGAPTLYVYLAPNSGGDSFYGSVALSGITGVGQWMHISVIRDNSQSLGQNSATTIAVFGNGVQNTLGINSGGVAPTDNLDTATVMNGKGMTLFGNNVYGYTSQVMDRKLDEFRIVKGDARPPRFYFGTPYGDATGGVLPHRATSTHRFTDDERTLILVSGQSANNHARAVSLVDESGLHLDNVHTSNSSLTNYPTQDGVGKQFTLSGAQHTTKESFVGNTSSILVDGIDDAVSLPSGHSVPAGTTSRTIDYWVKVHDHETYGYTFGHGGTSPGTTFGIAARGSTSANHDYFFQGWGTGDFDLPKPLAEVSQDWQHLQVTWDGTTTKVYVDGVFANSKNNSINTTASVFEIGRNGRGQSEPIGIYFDEFRASTSVEPPQIKWTHTQTAGAGNKDAYDIHGWRAHGHEFSDDNATSLLIHGDGYFNGTGMHLAETAFYGNNTGNSPSNQATVWFAGDSPASRDTLMVACWFQTTETALSYISRFGWSVGNIAINGSNQMKIQFGATTAWNVPCSDGGWHLVCAEYGETADDIIVYFDGIKVYSEMNGTASTYVKNDEAQLYIGSYNGTDYEFAGVVGQWAAWTHDAAADSNYMVENGVPKALFDAGPGANWKSATGDYSSTYAGFIRHYYAFGNQDSLGTGNDGTGTAHADTTTTVYDRAAAGSSYAARDLTGDGTITLGTPITDVFKDSSSANSIHHALVSGGGVHHSKAVTLKSDGTNGTSTTDHQGNTIFWCASNSTVTFANNSSFDYGNSAIRFDGVGTNVLDLASHSDFTAINTSDYTINFWCYIPEDQPNGFRLFGSGTNGYLSAPIFYGNDVANGRHLKLYWSSDGGTWNQWNDVDSTIDWEPDTWSHVSLVRTSGVFDIYWNGIHRYNDSSNTSDNANYFDGLTLGATGHTTSLEKFAGYMDEFKFLHESHPPRFYLGNQAPATGATFEQFKYVDFDGVNDWYQIGGTSTGYNSFDFNGTGTAKFTIAAWINQDSTSPTTQTIFGNMDGDSPYHGYSLKTEYGRTYFHAIGDNNVVAYGGYVTAGWTFIVGTMDLEAGVGRLWKNGREMSNGQTGGAKCTITYNGDAAPSIGSRGHNAGNASWDGTGDAQRDPFDGKIAHVGVWNDHLTQAEITAIYELGLGGNWATSYSGNMQGYWNFNIADGTDTPSTSNLYDLSGNSRDMTGVSITQIFTGFTPSNVSKRLTYGPLEYSANVQANTAVVGNNHYANTKAESVTAATFNSFVDDEYTVLLLRGGHADGNTVFLDSNTAAGETITFPAHSHSYGKSRVAKELTVQNGAHHENTDEVGLHGSSIDFDGTDDHILTNAHEDFLFEAGVPMCIECWHKKDDTSGVQTLVSLKGSGTVSHYFYFVAHNTVPYFMGGNGSGLNFSVQGVTNIYGTSAWHHVAFQRWNDQAMIFVDGVCESVVTTSDDADVAGPIDAHEGLRIGTNLTYTSEDFDGRIDELRITKGIPRYTPDGASVSGIVPGGSAGYAGVTGSSIPTTPYLRPTPYVATDGNRGYFGQGNVKLLVRSDTFPGDTNFLDSAASFNQNEVDGDFIKPLIFPAASQDSAVDQWQGNASNQEGKIIVGGGFTGGNALEIIRAAGSYANFYYPITNLNVGVTYDMVAYVTHGGGTTGLTESPATNYNFYAGPNPGTDNYSSPALTGTTTNAWVNIKDTFVATATTGWISLSRHNDSAAGSIYYSDVKVVPSLTPKVITNSGHTAADRPVIKTANSVTDYALSGGADGIYFDGTNDGIQIPFHKQIQFGQGGADFTFELWIYMASGTAYGYILDARDGSNTSNLYLYYDTSSDSFIFQDGVGSYHWRPPDIVASKWQHIGIQKHAGVYTFLRNGVMETPDTDGSLTPTSSKGKSVKWEGNTPLHIGRRYTSTNAFVVYFDEIRISNMARYTAQGLIDSDFPNPSTEFGIQTEGTTYGRFDTQVTANTTYKRYNYQHGKGVSFANFGDHSDYFGGGTAPSGIVDAGAVVGSPAGSGNFCIAWWQNNDVAAYLGPWGMGDGTSSNRVISAYSGGTTQDIYISGDGSNWNIHSGDSGAPPPKTGEWEFRAVSRQASDSIKFYHNGIVTKEITTRTDGTTAIGSIHQTSSARLQIGRDASNNLFDGKLGQWAMWHKGLSDAEIQDLYFAGPGLGVNWRTGAGISGTNYTSADGTGPNLYLYFDMNNNPDDYTADSSGGNLTDRSANARGINGTSGTTTYAADTKLLIHSNTDIDGDTSIVDSSPSEHVIDRIVADPKYANTGANRSSLAGASYNGIKFNTSNDNLVAFDTPAYGTDNFTVCYWIKKINNATSSTDNYWLSGGGGYNVDGGWGFRHDGAHDTDFWIDAGTQAMATGAEITDTNWHFVSGRRNGTTHYIGIDGTENSGSISGTTPLGSGVQIAGSGVSWGVNGLNNQEIYLDQIMVVKGADLGTTSLGNIRGGGAGNTHFGALGGLIVHEEYANTTTTANAATTLLLHSNNATHHTQGSRKFYNDTVNTAFYGAGTFSSTPAAAPKGHEAAGYFKVTAASGQYKFQGNTHSSTIDQNPQLRLRRGYSYIFDFSDGTNSGHQFYFANNTANSTGYAYGSGGTSGARPNAHLTGLFGTNADPNGTPAVTWTQLTATNFGDNSGTGDAYTYIKYEVPTDAPKNLYYRCSPHSTMGNAVFVMEATEPSPVKVSTLPALKTSGFNDRDWGGIGNSVINFSGAAVPSKVYGIFVDGDGTDLYWPAGTAFAFECWFNQPNIGTTQAVNWFSTESFYPGTTTLQIRSTNANGIQIQHINGTTQTYEIHFKSSKTGANSHVNQIFSTNKWHHMVVQRDGTNAWSAYVDAQPLTGHTTSGTETSAQNLNTDGQGIYIGGNSQTSSGNRFFEGFMQDVMVYKGVTLDANTVTQNYMTGRAGSFRTANSSVAVHIKSDAPYGSTTFTDAGPNALTVSAVLHGSTNKIYHHIEDNRTANTALYFDGASAIGPIGNEASIGTSESTDDRTIELWFKPMSDGANQGLIAFGGDSGASTYGTLAWQGNEAGDPVHYYVGGGSPEAGESKGSFAPYVWHHAAVTRRAGKTTIFADGVAVFETTKFATDADHDKGFVIGSQYYSSAYASYFIGFMDGIRYTKGIPRYTSGIPTDGQSPAKDYDDGRTSNISNPDWATSSTRRFYGINTHTYLQTTEYSTDANTVLMIRGDDAETANDGVNMYGKNGFHLEFKEVGAGDERDYNNFGTGVNGLGSDTSATQEFADDATVLLFRSRPNQANGSTQYINEVDQSRGNILGTSYHNEAGNIFSIDANTANVSVSSGGSGTY